MLCIWFRKKIVLYNIILYWKYWQCISLVSYDKDFDNSFSIVWLGRCRDLTLFDSWYIRPFVYGWFHSVFFSIISVITCLLKHIIIFGIFSKVKACAVWVYLDLLYKLLLYIVACMFLICIQIFGLVQNVTQDFKFYSSCFIRNVWEYFKYTYIKVLYIYTCIFCIGWN